MAGDQQLGAGREKVRRVGDNAVQFLLAYGMIISGAFGNRDF